MLYEVITNKPTSLKMNYLNKSKEELIQEITQLKQQVNQQEASYNFV